MHTIPFDDNHILISVRENADGGINMALFNKLKKQISEGIYSAQ